MSAFSASVIAADCTTTECACIAVTYHDPSAPVGDSLLVEKFSWVKAPGQFNRHLGKYEVVRIQYSYQDNGTQVCCSAIDNDQAQAPWTGFTFSHFPPLNGDRRESHFILYSQTPDYAEWNILVEGDTVTSAGFVQSEINNSLIDNLLGTSDSRLIPVSSDQNLIDQALLLNSANRLDLLNGC